MEFAEIPKQFRVLLYEDGECWLTIRHRPGKPDWCYQGRHWTPRRLLWHFGKRGPVTARFLAARCGNSSCVRPEHCAQAVDGMGSTARQRRTNALLVESEFELRMLVRSLRSRGYREHWRARGLLPNMRYRIGVGRGGNTLERRRRGPWWLYWQEPLRMAGTKAERREAA